MDLLNFIMGRVFHNTATKGETDIFISHVNNTIDVSYDSWKKEYDDLSEEEEQERFIQRMKKQGCSGNSNEDAMAFLDKEFPDNVRRQNLLERKRRRAS